MTNIEKKINIDSIRTALICEQIPFEYNVKELVIKIKGIDMTDILLAVHDYSGEKITDLIKENAELKETIRKGTFCGDWNDDVHMCQMYLKHKELQMYIHKLTKAKELLERWLRLYKTNTVKGIITDTEQFLKED